MANIFEGISEKWINNNFIDFEVRIDNIVYPDEDWIDYEDYMQAILINCLPGKIGELIVKFPADSTEDNRLHTHPASDRIVTVLEGSGDFICYRDEKVQNFPLFPGVRVWMPKGILHTFKSKKEGLLVQSLHNPFIPLDNPKCLVYPNLAVGIF